MSITLLGALTLALTLVAFLSGRPSWVAYVLAATMPFVTSSAIVVGDSKVQPFYVAAFAAVGALLAWRNKMTGPGLGQLPIAAFAYCAGTALLLPHLLAGRPVLVPRGGIDEQAARPGVLEFGLSNVAQSVYLGLALAVVVFFARFSTEGHVLTLAFSVGTAANLWAFAGQYLGAYYPAQIFESAIYGPSYAAAIDGRERFKGVFSEPSLLAVFVIAALTYSIFALATGRGPRKLLFGLLGLNALFFVLAYSGTAIAGIGVAGAVIGGMAIWRFLSGRARVQPSAMLLIVGAAIVVVLAAPRIYEFASGLIGQKLTTSSFGNRFATDRFSWDLFLDTLTFGVGLGSNRPSSFAMSLLSTVGLIGFLLLGAVAVRVVRSAAATGQAAPEVWCFVAVVLTKAVSEPNPNQPVMWMSLAAAAAAVGRRGSGADDDGAASVRGSGRTHLLSRPAQ